VTSKSKASANRSNAKKSTGPRSERGIRHSKGNALRHGLAVTIGADPSFSRDIEALTTYIRGDHAEPFVEELARQVAEAEIDLLRIRKQKAFSHRAVYGSVRALPEDYALLDEKLTKLERYEVRATSRWTRAMRALAAGAVKPFG
jgi:hypothetical protein